MNMPSDRASIHTSQDSGEFVDGGQTSLPGNGFTWIGSAFKVFTQAPGTWILIAIVLFLLSIAMAFVPLVGGLASTLLMPVFIGGIMLGCRKLDSGKQLVPVIYASMYTSYKDIYFRL